MDDEAIRTVVRRLARPHPAGGDVVERAAIIAEGASSVEIIAWITSHAGTAEASVAAAPRRGLHGARLGDEGAARPRAPMRFVLPAGTLA
jgi:hypothetical protein